MSADPAIRRQRAPRVRDDELVGLLQEVAKKLVGLTASALANAEGGRGADVTLGQYRLLIVLSARGRATPTALAAELGVSRPAIARMLKTLQARSLVARSRDQLDGRQAWIELAPPGIALVDNVLGQRAKALRAVVRTLSAPERVATRRSLQRMLVVLRPSVGRVAEPPIAV